MSEENNETAGRSSPGNPPAVPGNPPAGAAVAASPAAVAPAQPAPSTSGPPRKPWDSAGGESSPPRPLSDVLPAQSPAPAAEPAAAELREDQIANAVAFLSHPKVRGSAEASKRAFLQKKGLTQAEIAEAFRRVPPDSTPPDPTSGTQPTVAPSAGAAPPPSTAPQQIVAAQPAQPEPLRWSQVVVGAGLTALVAIGVRRLLEPYRYQILHSLSRAIAPAEDLEAEAKAKDGDEKEGEAALLVRSVASLEEQTAQLASSVQALTTNVALMQTVKRAEPPPPPAIPPELQATLASLANTLKHLGSGKEEEGGSSSVKAEIREIKSLLANKMAARSLGSSVPPQRTPAAPTTMSQVRPPVQAAPAEVKGKAPMQAPKSTSYQEVLQMLEQGKMPPGIRTDIADTPPNPNLPPSSSQAPPRRKPWESAAPRGGGGGGGAGDGSSQDTTASSGQAPFWVQQGHGAEEELPPAPPPSAASAAPSGVPEPWAVGGGMNISGTEPVVGKRHFQEARSVFEQQAEQFGDASGGTSPAPPRAPPSPPVTAPHSNATAAGGVVEVASGEEEERWMPPERPKPVLQPQQLLSAPAAASYASVEVEEGSKWWGPRQRAPPPRADSAKKNNTYL